MLFIKRFTAIFITRSQIRAAIFSSRGKLIREIGEYAWDKETLADILKKIATQGPSRTRVVFGEGFSYVAAMSSTEKNREKISSLAQELIPEELDSNWDFQDENEASQSLQIAAIQKSFFEIFKESFSETSLWVETAEPQSIAIARLLPKTGAFVFISKEERTLFGAVKNGAVVGTYLCENEKASEIFHQFIIFAEKKCAEKPRAIYADNEINVQAKVFSESGLKVESIDLDPLRAIATKRHLSGRDTEVMNIVFETEQMKKEKTFSIVSRREKILRLIFLVGLILAAVVLVVKFLKR